MEFGVNRECSWHVWQMTDFAKGLGSSPLAADEYIVARLVPEVIPILRTASICLVIPCAFDLNNDICLET